MKINRKIFCIIIIFFLHSCDCHYNNTRAYVKCLEDHKGNEDYCLEIKSKYPVNTCGPIDYDS